MKVIKKRKLDIALWQVFEKGTPILGICLGSQIILSDSEEGDTECLGLIKGTSLRFKLKNRNLKVPHMGWNEVRQVQEHYILKDLKPKDELYFVHSYYPQPVDEKAIFARSEYEIDFPVVIGFKNLIATQFHPEKSGPKGLKILRNFTEWDGTNVK